MTYVKYVTETLWLNSLRFNPAGDHHKPTKQILSLGS